MHRTLFSPSMVETFRSCKRAYEFAYVKFSSGNASGSLAAACKRFVLKALAEINKGRLTTVHQVQKYMGQCWPVDRANGPEEEKELSTRAFLFAFKALTRYVQHPYRPHGAEVAAIALKVRARVPHVRVYVEDTIDLVLWHPNERRLELVNFQLQPLKPINPAWPSPSALIKTYLAERLKIRWEFEKLSLTTVRVGTRDYPPQTISLEDSIYRLHWDELVKVLDEMKNPPTHELGLCTAADDNKCRHCYAIKSAGVYESAEAASYSLSA